MFSFISNYEIILFSLFSGFLSIIYFLIAPKYFKNIFGICVSNSKTSLYHDPLLRGLGVIYLLPLIMTSMYNPSIFSVSELILVFVCTIIGFYDDKKELSQKGKLIILSIIFFVYTIFTTDQFNQEFLSFFRDFFYFIFLILFFNQIDGINGLAAITFIVTLLFILIISFLVTEFAPIFVCLFIYMFFNLKGKIGIQGEAGSFFMGSLTFVLSENLFQEFELFYVIFSLGPALIDIISTTLIRFAHKENLFEGHRNNLYQILVTKYKDHIRVSLGFGFIQTSMCLFLFYFIEKLSNYNLIMLMLSISGLMFIFFMYFAIKIQKNIF